MDINYELIIKYLVKKNSFITPKNNYTYASSFPENFRELLNDKFFRCGVLTDNNLSFWSSLLNILQKNFVTSVDNDEVEIINHFKNQLIDKYKKSNISSFLKEFEKNDFREMFKTPNNNCIQYIADIIDINIFIFDFESNKILSFYKNDKMNPWKPSIILASNKNNYEPIMYEKDEVQKIFNYNNEVFKNLITSNLIESYKKDYDFINSINDILKIESDKFNIVNDLIIDDSETDELFINDIYDEIKSMSKYKMNKMKINELLEITKKINIDVTKKPTKALLIEMINNKVNNIIV
jgi:hypothetical protein